MYYVASGKPIVFAGDEKPPINAYELGSAVIWDWSGVKNQ